LLAVCHHYKVAEEGKELLLLLRRSKQAGIAPGSETLAGRKTSE